MKTSDRGSCMFDKRKILMPHSLKIHLRGWVCYNGIEFKPVNSENSWYYVYLELQDGKLMVHYKELSYKHDARFERQSFIVNYELSILYPKGNIVP
jgi:hypothetical protein